MVTFAENGVKVFEFVDFFASFDLDEVRSALEDVVMPVDTHPGSVTRVPPDVQGRANKVKAAREEMISFLRHTAVTDEVPALREAYQSIVARKFGDAHDLLSRVLSHPDLPTITLSTVELAYSGPISFRALIRDGVDGEGEPVLVDVTRTISQGYEGARAPAVDVVELNRFMQVGAERKRLLDNESLQGLGRPQDLIESIDSYATLLPEAVTARVSVLGVRVNLFQRYAPHTGTRQAVAMPGIFVTWSGPPRGITPAQQFAALRSAFAHLELGDALLRRNRVLASADRNRLSRVYAAAVRLVTASGVSPANALRGQVTAHAVRQCAKLRAGLNALGLSESFVPVLRYSTLARAAEAAINELAQSAGDALASLRSAEDLIGEELPLIQEQAEEDLRTGIYLSKIDIANLEEDKANEQVSMIEDQRDILLEQTGAGLFSSIMSASPDQMVGVAVSGIVEAGVTMIARRTELGHQLEIAKSDVDIAQIQSDIAVTEAQLSQRRKEHLAQRLDFLINRQVNADLYLTLAELHEKRAARVLDAAIFLAYLAERAFLFARGEDLPPKIRFNYWDDPDPEVIPRPELLDAVARLNFASNALSADFDELSRLQLVMEDDNLQTFQEHISLSEHYPLEFARLLQDGEMHFEYSLYQLSKRFPFSHKCRLYGAAVQVDAIGPAGGPRGVLEHSGAYLVRHKKSTLTEATRLVPTEAELREARQRQREQGEGVAPVGGVLYYVLDPDPLVSTLNSPLIPVNAPDDLLPEGLRKAMEGYGPTGLWRLELHNLDELRITDITVHFGLVAGVDTGGLESQVERLIHEYESELAPNGEPLDKISAFSLQQLFPDRFAALRTGAATVLLDRSSFPAGLANLEFKALVAQALNADGKGIEGIRLRYGRADAGFRRERVTSRGGFSEDLENEPEILPSIDRFSVEGLWQVELLDPQQFAQLGDLRIFVMYSYR